MCLNCFKVSRECKYDKLKKPKNSSPKFIPDNLFPNNGDTNPDNTNDMTKLSPVHIPDSQNITPSDRPYLFSNIHVVPPNDVKPHESTITLTSYQPVVTNPDIPSAQLPSSNEYFEVNDALFSGASMLASDLNDLLAVDHESLLNDSTPQSEYSVAPNDKGPIMSVEIFDDKPIFDLISSFDSNRNHKNYLRLFYEKYSLWLMPLSPSSGSKNFFNKIIIHQAQRVPFLLNAIFSVTAAFEYEETKSSQDDYYKKYYINLCLKGLNSVFEFNHKILEYIEPLILTSLLLVTDSASAINGSWRNHLQGSNNLFRQYLSIYKKNSPTILLATVWFASFEIIAVITNPMGGLIKSEEQLDDILLPTLFRDEWNLAIQLGFVLPNGYNVFLGQSSDDICLFIHFLKLSIKVSNSKNQSIESNDLVQLMAMFSKALEFQLASSDGLIEQSSPYYPKTSGMNFLPAETYGYTNNIVFSWFDLSDKIHIRGLYLTVLTHRFYLNLPKESKVVQDVVAKMLNMCYFFDGIDFDDTHFNCEAASSREVLHDRRLLMLHSSLLICGLCCINRKDQLKIEVYFKALIRLGARTVETSFTKLKNSWQGGDVNLDFVPYL